MAGLMADDDDEVLIEPDDRDSLLNNASRSLLLKPSPESEPKIGFFSCRLVLLIMSFLGFINVYCLRVNLSVALVVMVNHTVVKTNDTHDECPVDSSNNATSPVRQDGEFNWDSNVQGLILGSFFYGYVFTQIPGGWLGEKFGGKWPLGLGVLSTSILTLLTPLAARWSVYALVAVRVLEGIGEGMTFPAMHAILGKWAPPYQRSRMGAFVYAGAQLGTVIGMPLSGVLCNYGFSGGWPSVFYVFGSAGCVWFVFWTFLCYNSPAEHPRISAAEREFIETSIGEMPLEKEAVPWKSILTSRAVWACAAAHFANNWGYYTLLTCLPTYMKDVLKFDVTKNGFYSGLPYLACWFMMTAGGQVADFLRQRNYLSTQKTRKLFNVLGLMLPGVFLIVSGFLGCEYMLTVAMVVLAVGISGLAMSGYGVNHLDLAPQFAGVLMGLTNCVASIPGFVGPQVAGALTNNQSTRGQWQKVFYIATVVYCFGTAIFVLFGSGEKQKWASHRGRRASSEATTSTKEK